MLTPVDKSQSAGSDEMSNPLSMDNAKSAGGPSKLEAGPPLSMSSPDSTFPRSRARVTLMATQA